YLVHSKVVVDPATEVVQVAQSQECLVLFSKPPRIHRECCVGNQNTAAKGLRLEGSNKIPHVTNWCGTTSSAALHLNAEEVWDACCRPRTRDQVYATIRA